MTRPATAALTLVHCVMLCSLSLCSILFCSLVQRPQIPPSHGCAVTLALMMPLAAWHSARNSGRHAARIACAVGRGSYKTVASRNSWRLSGQHPRHTVAVARARRGCGAAVVCIYTGLPAPLGLFRRPGRISGRATADAHGGSAPRGAHLLRPPAAAAPSQHSGDARFGAARGGAVIWAPARRRTPRRHGSKPPPRCRCARRPRRAHSAASSPSAAGGRPHGSSIFCRNS